MKILASLVISALAFATFAQDGVVPLRTNPSLTQASQYTQVFEKNGIEESFDSTFLYFSDTLDLPFFDEFSRNNFQNYPRVYTGPGITSELFSAMLDEVSSLPLPAGSEYTDTKTFLVEDNIDNGTMDTVFYDSVVFDYSPLDVYPVVYNSVYGFPAYFVNRTIENGNTTDDTVFVIDPEYTQFDARIFFNQLDDSTKLWLDSYAYHNYRMAKDPISLGVVTFDGLDQFGYPYNFGSVSNAINDYLTSKPINMGSFAPSDSVYLSFLLQTTGLGDPTENTDSFYVEFYSPVDQIWERVWSTHGNQGSAFKAGHISITDPKYFENGFQFRFLNYGLPCGALDQFNLDYVSLRELSSFDDTLFKDFAFSYPLYTLLKDYTQVPWDHFRNSPNNKMTDNLRMVLRNNETVAANNSAGGSLSVYYNDLFEGSFNFSGAVLSNPDLDYAPRTHYFSNLDLSGAYEFDPNQVNDTMAEFDWIAEASVPFTNFAFNDSTFGTQVFKAVYAYDDGTAELAYGPNGSQARLAYKFEAYEADSLVAIQIHFVPAANDVSNKLFLLTVWNDDNGEPGDVLYQDDFFNPRQAQYNKGQNGFFTYYFTDDVKVPVDQVFYVGWRQIDSDRLNVGFDVNIDNSDKVFYSTDNENTWENASVEGSVMMRPMFSTKLDYQLAVEEVFEEEFDFKFYPNPTSGLLSIQTDFNDAFSLKVYDINGREVLSKSNTQLVDLANFEAGIYLIRVFNAKNEVINMAKIVKR